MQLVTGSRAEGFALSSDYIGERPDFDLMFIYGGDWCVRTPYACNANDTESNVFKDNPEMAVEGCAPGYCRINIKPFKQLSVPTDIYDFPGSEQVRRQAQEPFALLLFGALLWGWYKPSSSLIRPLFTYAVYVPFLMGMFSLWAVEDEMKGGLYVELNKQTCLSSKEFLRWCIPLSYRTEYINPPQFQGPSHTLLGDDLVPALICLQPFPCMDQYLARERSTIWPTPEALAQISATPGMLVPTGMKGSPNCDIEWRFSFSAQEIILSQEMPPWIKAGYRAFKYTTKHLLHALRISVDSTNEEVIFQDASSKHLIARLVCGYRKYRIEFQQNPLFLREEYIAVTKENESRVCSYHLKTILLWSLEDPNTWQEQCPFRLMLRLLRDLENHLTSGSLRHYFNIDCNLFQNVSIKELAFTRACVGEILRNPFFVMCRTAVKRVDSSNHNVSRSSKRKNTPCLVIYQISAFVTRILCAYYLRYKYLYLVW